MTSTLFPTFSFATQSASAYVSTRQHTSAYVSIRLALAHLQICNAVQVVLVLLLQPPQLTSMLPKLNHYATKNKKTFSFATLSKSCWSCSCSLPTSSSSSTTTRGNSSGTTAGGGTSRVSFVGLRPQLAQ